MAPDPAVTFAPFGVLLDMNATAIVASDGDSLGASTIDGTLWGVVPPGNAPTFVARDSVLEQPCISFGDDVRWVSADPRFTRASPLAYWFIGRLCNARSPFYICSASDLNQGSAYVGVSTSLGVAMVLRDSGATPFAIAPANVDWARASASFGSDGAVARFANRRVTGVIGSAGIAGLRLITGSGEYRLHRLIVTSSAPTESALSAADDWIAMTFGHRVRPL
jgi:hypothetical protein